MSAGANVSRAVTPMRSTKSRFFMSKRVVKVGSATLPLAGELEGEAHELGAEELALALELHREVVPDAPARRARASGARGRGSARLRGAASAGSLWRKTTQRPRPCCSVASSGIDDRRPSSIRLSTTHCLPSVVGVDDGEVAELRVDVADARDRRAVVVHAAHQQQIAGLEGDVLARIEGGIDERVEVVAAKAAQGGLAGAELREARC